MHRLYIPVDTRTELTLESTNGFKSHGRQKITPRETGTSGDQLGMLTVSAKLPTIGSPTSQGVFGNGMNTPKSTTSISSALNNPISIGKIQKLDKPSTSPLWNFGYSVVSTASVLILSTCTARVRC